MTVISNEFAAEIVAKMRAHVESRDELTEVSDHGRDGDLQIMLILKLYDDLQALTKATAFLGGGIPPVTKVSG